MSRPDYIIIGAMKCGTSTLAAQLGAHRAMFMTTPKEPNFFSDDDIFAKGQGWYEGLFTPAATGDLKGEASTHYTKLPDLPQALPRLLETLGTEARLIYLIRDPLDRLVSHYIHEWTQGVMSSDLETALQEHPALVAYSRYAMQIAPWIEAFGPEAVHVDTLEAMKADPAALMGRVGAFLGRDDLGWLDELEAQNVSSERLQKRKLDWLMLDNPAATFLRRNLIPQALRDRVKAGRKMQTRPTLTDAQRAALIPTFRDDRDALHALIPNRPDLDAAYRSVLT